MAKRVAAVAVVHSGKILMGRRRDNNKWTNPGGHLEKGEDPLTGAIREVKEEAGLDINPNQMTKLDEETITKPNGEKIKVYAYQANLIRKPPTTMVTDPDEEVQRWHWVKPSEMKNKELHVPFNDNILLKNIVVEEKPKRKPGRPPSLKLAKKRLAEAQAKVAKLEAEAAPIMADPIVTLDNGKKGLSPEQTALLLQMEINKLKEAGAEKPLQAQVKTVLRRRSK